MNDDSVFLKILVIGDSGVGKTSLLNQYCYKKFDQTVPVTVGCDFTTKVMTNFKGRTIRLQLWDIAGQERFQSVSKLYVRGAVGCVVVTDITNEVSWNNANKWKEIIEENCDYIDTKPIPIVLVQNKSDLVSKLGKLEDFQINETAQQMAQKNKFLALYQTSAKNNQNLDQVFETLTENILERNLINEELMNFEDRGAKKNNSKPENNNIRLNNNTAGTSSSKGSGKTSCC